jgi:hypothetical protein
LNGVLGSIAAVDIWRDNLVSHFPCVFNDGLELGADFAVEDLEINLVATVG